MEKWKERVLGLSGETARAPTELAEALYFLSSAGLDTNEIMPTLEMSAKAAASGLGETADVARLTANVLNAYADSGIKAAKVTDILVAAVREGTAEPDEFANAMGRILPIASKAGVEFENVAASLATVSNIGLDVNEGVTAMRGLLQALVAPASQSAEAMKKLGISTDDMRQVLSEQGILGALRLLEERTGGNIDKIQDIIPNVRALTGAFGLTTQEAEKVNKIFQRVADSTGSMDEAFEETQRGPAFQLEKRLNELRVAGIRLGQRLIPIATGILDTIAGWARGLAELDPGQLDLVVKALGGLVALGPGLFLVGKAIGLISGVGSVLTGIGRPAAKAGAGLASLKVGLAGLGATLAGGVVAYALGQVFKQIAENRQYVDDLADAMLKGRDAAAAHTKEVRDFIDANREGGLIAETFADSLEESTAAAEKQATFAVREMVRGLRLLPGALNDSRNRLIELAISSGDFALAMKLVNETERHWLRTVKQNQRGMGELATEMERNNRTADAYIKAREKAQRADAKMRVGLDALSAGIARMPPEHETKIKLPGIKAGIADSRALNNTLGDQPPSKDTRISTPGIQEAIAHSRALNQSLNSQPPSKSTRVTLIGIAEAIAQSRALNAQLSATPRSITSTVMVNTIRTSSVQAREGLAAGGIVQLSKGALIAAQHGLIARGPTVLAGEGSYSTFAGRGAEAIIPLGARGIGILGQALERADARRGGERPMVVQVQAPSLVGVRIRGRIDTSFGPGDMEAVIEDEFETDRAFKKRLARMKAD